MDNRPHSRDKGSSQGSASVGKGKKVSTGGQQVGGNSRPSSSQSPAQNTSSHNSSFQPHGNQSFNHHNNYNNYHQNGYQQNVSGTQGAPTRAGGGFPIKRLLIIVVAIAAIIFGVKQCGGGANLGGITDTLGNLGNLGGITDGIDLGSLSSITSLFGSSNWSEGIASSPSYSDTTADVSVSSKARDRYVTPVGNGNDTVTIMVYMCGTDLESKHGMASSDLKEMMNANLSDKINIIVETGGCKKWQINGISNTVNQIYKVEKGGMKRLESDWGKSAMTDPANLTKFIDYCEKNYEADRYFLILWDHGGGTLSGYGYDEKNPSSSSMTLTKINDALKKADCKFDFIGFDACLMSTLETALVCNEYADYMIASEEVEPGTGWYYTTWLNTLSENTSVSTVKLAKSIIDSYMTSTKGSAVTLAVVDLAELQGTVPTTFSKFASSTADMIESNDYKAVSNARANARQFSAQSKINQIDLSDFATRIGTKEAKALTEAIKGCVKYNGSTISGANGLSIYFPYESLGSMNNAVNVYNNLGMDKEYIDCIKSFASLGAAGQTAASSSLFSSAGGSSAPDLGSLLSLVGGGSTSSSASPITSLLGGLLSSGTTSSAPASAGSSLDVGSVLSLLSAFSGRSMPESMAWADSELITDSAEYVSKNYINPANIAVTYKNGTPVLKLSEKEWSLIQKTELNVFVDDGEGFIDLGLDNTFEFNKSGDLILAYDGSWITVDGNVAAYYMVSDTDNGDGTYTTVGRIPAILNGELVNLNVIFDTAHPDGVITGASLLYGSETATAAKADMPIRDGDTLQLLCDYYDYEGNFDSAYTLSDEFTVEGDGLDLYMVDLEDTTCSVSYKLTDIYGNVYWTPALEFEF